MSAAARALRVAACMALLAACSPEQKAPPAPVAAPAPPQPKVLLAMKDLMEHVIDPAADVFWGASGTIITAKGETSRAPTTDAGWEAAFNAAATLAETSNLLTMGARARDQQQWVAFAQELGEASIEGMKAAKAKDEKAVFDTGGRIYLACRSCHMKYLLGYK
jgi:hypothetical protein